MSAPSRPGAPRASSRGGGKRTAAPRTRTGVPAAAGTTKTRPAGPSGPSRVPPAMNPHVAPARVRGSWAGMLTWRAAVMAGVMVLAIAVLLPTVRVYLDQQAQLNELRAEVEQARAEVDGLEAEVARWDDPAFVQAQARDRKSVV